MSRIILCILFLALLLIPGCTLLYLTPMTENREIPLYFSYPIQSYRVLRIISSKEKGIGEEIEALKELAREGYELGGDAVVITDIIKYDRGIFKYTKILGTVIKWK